MCLNRLCGQSKILIVTVFRKVLVYVQPEPPLCPLAVSGQCHLHLSALIQRRDLQLQQDVMS